MSSAINGNGSLASNFMNVPCVEGAPCQNRDSNVENTLKIPEPWIRGDDKRTDTPPDFRERGAVPLPLVPRERFRLNDRGTPPNPSGFDGPVPLPGLPNPKQPPRGDDKRIGTPPGSLTGKKPGKGPIPLPGPPTKNPVHGNQKVPPTPPERRGIRGPVPLGQTFPAGKTGFLKQPIPPANPIGLATQANGNSGHQIPTATTNDKPIPALLK
jgi:hypothetical protein